MSKKQKCELCDDTNVELVTVIYSNSPFGIDSDTVYLCTRHKTEAEDRYQVKTIQ